MEPVPLGSDVSVRGRWLAGGPSDSVAMLSLLSLTHSTCSPQPLSRMPSSGCTATASHSSAGSSPASRVSIVELGSRLASGPVGPWLCPQEPSMWIPFLTAYGMTFLALHSSKIEFKAGKLRQQECEAAAHRSSSSLETKMDTGAQLPPSLYSVQKPRPSVGAAHIQGGSAHFC